jgi:hypothetical protein
MPSKYREAPLWHRGGKTFLRIPMNYVGEWKMG